MYQSDLPPTANGAANTYAEAMEGLQTPDDLPEDLRCVVAGFDLHVSYRKLIRAATILSRPDSIFVATNTDEQFPHKGGIILPGHSYTIIYWINIYTFINERIILVSIIYYIINALSFLTPKVLRKKYKIYIFYSKINLSAIVKKIISL